MLKAVVVGNLTKDCEMKTTRNGNAMATFNMAVNLRERDNATGQSLVQYVSVAAFGKLAETSAQRLVKGRRVTVLGEIKSRAYMGNDGQPKSQLMMSADDIEFMFRAGDPPEEVTVPQDAGQTQSNFRGNNVPDGFVEIDTDQLPFELSGERW